MIDIYINFVIYIKICMPKDKLEDSDLYGFYFLQPNRNRPWIAMTDSTHLTARN